MPRLVYWAGVGLLLVAGAFLLTERLVHPSGVTEANAKRIKPGMTAAWVERLLGKHPVLEPGGPVFSPNTVSISYGWSGPEGHAEVSFARSGLVSGVVWYPRTAAENENP